jgi:hypothetical protein
MKIKVFASVAKMALFFCLSQPVLANGTTNIVTSPNEASLLAAIQIGGWVGLQFNATLTITNTIDITNNVVLDGTGFAVTISGGDAVPLFFVSNGANLTVSNLTVANGYCVVTNGPPGTLADGGAIYNDGGTLTLVSCSLTYNAAQSLMCGGVARGGAIFNNGGTVSLYQSVIANNEALGGGPNNRTATNSMESIGTGLGGAIYNTIGTVTIIGCNIYNNSSLSVCETDGSVPGNGLTMGGAAFQASGSMLIASSSFVLNQAVGGQGQANFGSFAMGGTSPAYGGALAVSGGSLSLDHTVFSMNQCTGGAGLTGYGIILAVASPAYGGAVYCASAWTVNDSSFLGDQALAGQNGVGGASAYGGGIYNAGTLTLNRCSICTGYAQGGSGAVYDSDIGCNGGNGLGGGIFNAAQMTVTNCTIALNSTSAGSGAYGSVNGFGNNGNALGGGFFNSGVTSVLMNVTIASNYCIASGPSYYGTNGLAAGLQIANTSGALHLHNSLLAYSGTNSDAYGTITDDGYNICSDGSANFASGSSQNFTDPQLASLGNYGGPTLCMVLLPTSPAIDSADSADFPNTDQRGYFRPVGAGPDMGAYEYGSYPLIIPTLNITAAPSNALLSFTASMPQLYRLQSSTDLNNWTDLNTNGPFANPTNVSQTVSLQGYDYRFFRLLVQ